MKHKIVNVKNLQGLAAAYNRLAESSFGTPKIGLVKGSAGYGKSTAIGWLADKNNGVFVTATPVWTPSAMLKSILKELALDETISSNQAKLDAIVESLLMGQQPLFVDEADFLFDAKNKMLETLRSIHDLAGVPVILVGMDQIARKVSRRPQFDSRIAQRVEFAPSDLEDTGRVAAALLDVEVAPDLLEKLHQSAAGNMRLITVGLANIEGHAHLIEGIRTSGRIDETQWKASGKAFF